MKKTPAQMTQELYQAVIGIPENPNENGLIGEVKDMNKRLRCVEKNIGKIKGIGAGAVIVISIAIALSQLFSG